MPLDDEAPYLILEGAGQQSTVLRYNSTNHGDRMFHLPPPGRENGMEIANMQWTEWDGDGKEPHPRRAIALAAEPLNEDRTNRTELSKSYFRNLYIQWWGTGFELPSDTHWDFWHNIRGQATRRLVEATTPFQEQENTELTFINIMATGVEVGMKLKGYNITVIGSEMFMASQGIGYWLLDARQVAIINSGAQSNQGATDTTDLLVEESVHNGFALGFHAWGNQNKVQIQSPTFSLIQSFVVNEQEHFFPESLPPLERWQDIDLANGWKEMGRTGTAWSSSGQYITVSTGTAPNSKVLMKQDVFGLAPKDYANRVNWDKPVYILLNLCKTGNDPETVAHIQLTQDSTYGELAAPGVGLKIANLDLQGDTYSTSGNTFPLDATISEEKDVEVLIAHIPSYGVVYMVDGIVKASRTNRPEGTPKADYGIAISIGNGSTGGTDSTLTVYRIRIYSAKKG